MINQTTLNFLKELAANNNRDWFLANKQAYDAAKANTVAVVAQICTQIAQQFDPSIATVRPEKTLFRQNRDIRFSKDKSPYKINFGAHIIEDKHNETKAGYYLHIEPNDKSFLGGGMYQPSAAVLKSIRQEIDYHTDEFRKIISNPDFVQQFGSLNGRQLKTAPKDYDKTHPAIDLLRFQDYVVGRNFTDKQLIQPDFIAQTVTAFAALKPFNDFLNKAVS